MAVGLLLAAGLVMAEASSQFGLLPLVVVAVSSVFVWRTNYSPLWVLVGGGVLGSSCCDSKSRQGRGREGSPPPNPTFPYKWDEIGPRGSVPISQK